jgi:hypothetical protein
MRVWYDDTADLIVIEGLKQVFPALSLKAVMINNRIGINVINDASSVVMPMRYTRYSDQNGNPFPNILECLTYLINCFAMSEKFTDTDFVNVFDQNLKEEN